MIRPSGDIENLQALKEFSVAYLRHEQDLDLEAFNVDFNVFSLESSLYKNGQVDQIVKMLIENGHTYEKGWGFMAKNN